MVIARLGQSCALAAANGASRSVIAAAPIAFSIQLGPLRPPLAGEGWGGGDLKYFFIFRSDFVSRAPSLSLQPKSDVSDFGQLIKRPNSGKPEFGCKRGRGRWSASHRTQTTGRAMNVMRAGLWPILVGARRAENPLPASLAVIAASP